MSTWAETDAVGAFTSNEQSRLAPVTPNGQGVNATSLDSLATKPKEPPCNDKVAEPLAGVITRDWSCRELSMITVALACGDKANMPSRAAIESDERGAKRFDELSRIHNLFLLI